MTPYDLSFRKDKVDAKLCTKTLTKDEVAQFRKVRVAKPDRACMCIPRCIPLCTCLPVHISDVRCICIQYEVCNSDMQAVSDDFYFQMYYDNLPIWGFIGALPVYIITRCLQSI